jgi:hypothetical protein
MSEPSQVVHVHALLPADMVAELDALKDGRLVKTRTAALILVLERGLKPSEKKAR